MLKLWYDSGRFASVVYTMVEDDEDFNSEYKSGSPLTTPRSESLYGSKFW